MIASLGQLDVVAAPLEHHHVFDVGKFRAGLVDVGLQGDHASASPGAVAGQDHLAVRIVHPIHDRTGAEAAEDHGVGRTDPGAGQHRDRDLGHHAHVDGDDVTLAHAERLQRIPELRRLSLEIAVGEPEDLRAIPADGLAFPDDRGVVAMSLVDVAVHAVVAEVERPIGEPPGVGAVPLQHRGERLHPAVLPGGLAPEGLGVVDRTAVPGFVIGHRRDPRAADGFGEAGGWRKDTVFAKD